MFLYYCSGTTRQGRKKEFFKGEGGGGVVLNAILKKGSFCTDLFYNTLYRKCMEFAPPPPLESYF